MDCGPDYDPGEIRDDEIPDILRTAVGGRVCATFVDACLLAADELERLRAEFERIGDRAVWIDKLRERAGRAVAALREIANLTPEGDWNLTYEGQYRWLEEDVDRFQSRVQGIAKAALAVLDAAPAGDGRA
jgi:hypothetical protein